MKIIYFGTPHFAATVLHYLLDHSISVSAVITKPDKPKGRSGALQPTPVKLIAEQHQLPLYQPSVVSTAEVEALLTSFKADLFVVVAYGEILKASLLAIPPLGCINLHASLLPHYRGAAPIQRCIMAGEKESGLTIMHMVKKMDAGDMIRKVKVPLSDEMTFGELEQVLCTKGSEALLQTLRDFERGVDQREPQDHSQATFAPKIELEECEIDWQLPANHLHHLIRGVNPHPLAWCWVELRQQKLRLKIIQAKVESLAGLPGQILSYDSSGFIVGCGQASLKLLTVQLEGKKAMEASVFMQGIAQHSLRFISSPTYLSKELL